LVHMLLQFLATMVLGREIAVIDKFDGLSPILLPMVIAGLGIIFSIIGCAMVKISDDNGDVQKAFNIGNWFSIALTVIASYFLVTWMLPENLICVDMNFQEWVFSGLF
jgi:K(+)-stimulated pyrophosphate-energized sodium pump